MSVQFVIARLRAHLRPFLAAGLLIGCSPGQEAPTAPITQPVGEVAQEPTAEMPLTVSAVATPSNPRGMWVLAEGSRRVLEDSARIGELVEHARELGVSDLFVQVYRGGRAWYDASLADATPYRELLAQTGEDTLAALIERAHGTGLRVHAWVNVLSLSQNRDAPLLRELGPGAVLVDRRGRSLLDYPGLDVPPPDGDWYRMGTRGVYLDPAAPGVAERLVATFRELVTRYPELDGLHLDYIRHPGALPFVPGSRFGVGLDFGYGEASRFRFQRETGLTGPYRDSTKPGGGLVHADEWDAWRRDKVSELVAGIRVAVLEARPGLVLSAAVNSYTDRAYLSLAQDWRRWLEEGLIDLAIPMVYTRDDRLLRYQLEDFARAAEAERIWPGLGVWLFARQPERALAQIEIARRAGARGEVLFSYDSIVEAPGLQTVLGHVGEPPAPR